jgi:predicted kinase
MHGPSGAGKSWLAERLVPALGAVRVRSDLERKRLVAPQARHAPHGVREAGLYSAAMNEATYARLNEWATAALAGRWSLILDATFLEAGRRDACRSLAERLAADLLLVDCVADRATLRARVVQRAVVGKDVSDADAAVLEAQLESGTALRADELQNTVRIDTRDADAVEHVRRRALALQAAA